MFVLFVFFFFQAEDGIRDVAVTGVQTCALPISAPRSVSLGTGGAQQFVAYGRLNNGDSVAVNVTWSAQGGTIASSGLYTAGSIPGGYVVTATASGITGTAILSVTDVSVASVAVSPAAATVSVGGTPQLRAV